MVASLHCLLTSKKVITPRNYDNLDYTHTNNFLKGLSTKISNTSEVENPFLSNLNPL